MAFQTNQPHFLADQHSRILRTVRHMAALAAFLAHGSVLEDERSTFVAMALETGGLIRARQTHQAGFETAVRIVAIDAGHRIFGNRMFERLRERRLHIQMTAHALSIDVRRFARD